MNNRQHILSVKEVSDRDSLSPYLFNLVVDALAKILDKAKEHRYIKRLDKFNNN
jgi:hypothetical protein